MRVLPSWIDGFTTLTEMTGSPEIFRKWTAISLVACALERRVWTETVKGQLFPNLYVILIGPPGAGKTVVANHARPLLMELEESHISSSSVTKASLADELLAAERKIVRPTEDPPVITYNSLAILSNELGVLIPSYESDFMNVLTDLWNCKIYSESRRTKNRQFSIENTQLNLLACTTPSYLNNLLPLGAWDQGFLSRCLLIYSGGGNPQDLFSKKKLNNGLYTSLVRDLRQVTDLYGLVTWSDSAGELMNAWHLSGFPYGGKPIPNHPKLQNYNTRRTEHLLKLCTIACVSTSETLVITEEHFTEALDWLVEMETFIPDIFKAMTTGGDQQVINEAWHFAYQSHMGGGEKGVPQHKLVEFLAQRTPSHNVMRVLDVMEKGGLLKRQNVDKVGEVYIPRPLT